jgi:hypothetical protein
MTLGAAFPFVLDLPLPILIPPTAPHTIISHPLTLQKGKGKAIPVTGREGP